MALLPAQAGWLDGGALRISNYRREDRVPLARVAAVTENRWVNIRPVTVVAEAERG